MATKAFISYSHADEKALERLHKHLAMLIRDETLDAWTDHQIKPGDKLSDKIDESLESSDLLLALLSPDYLASNYCYEKEFLQAQQLASSGKIRIIPIILEPCDWISSPFSQYMALPKDGKPVSDWTNQNNAYLDIVTGLRRVIEEGAHNAASKKEVTGLTRPPSRRIRAKQDFDSIQRSEFADEAFEAISSYFENSCAEMNDIGEGNLKARFEKMDSSSFTCTVVNRGRRQGSEAHITVHNKKGRGDFGDITYVYERHAKGNTSNGSISVDADDYNMFLTLDSFSRNEESKLGFSQASEILWLEFVKKAGIEYG